MKRRSPLHYDIAGGGRTARRASWEPTESSRATCAGAKAAAGEQEGGRSPHSINALRSCEDPAAMMGDIRRKITHEFRESGVRHGPQHGFLSDQQQSGEFVFFLESLHPPGRRRPWGCERASSPSQSNFARLWYYCLTR